MARGRTDGEHILGHLIFAISLVFLFSSSMARVNRPPASYFQGEGGISWPLGVRHRQSVQSLYTGPFTGPHRTYLGTKGLAAPLLLRSSPVALVPVAVLAAYSLHPAGGVGRGPNHRAPLGSPGSGR